LVCVLFLSLLSGCSTAPTVPNTAQEKSVEVDGRSILLGGEYWDKRNKLTIFVDGEPIMRGSFPPYTPTLKLNATYDEVEIGAYCYFGSVLTSKGRIVGAISGAIQGAKGKSADKCELTVEDQRPVTLYF
jgi:hypothetical protein